MDMGRVGIPSEPPQPSVGTVPDDSSDIVRSANSRIRELIRFQRVHCDIVHWVGSDPRVAGCMRHLANEISSEDSGPTHLGCTLSLMSAERIRQNLRSLFLKGSGNGSFGNGICAEAV